MQIRIEPPNAMGESYSGLSKKGLAPGPSRVLDLVVQRQELDKWCWAALAASLGRYYGTACLQQHEAASALLGFECSGFREDPQVATRCDVYAMLDAALRLAGCYSHWSPGKPTFERVCAELDAGRPLCLRVQWLDGGSHYLALTGHCADSGEVYVQDPKHGHSVQSFATFPRRYRTGGVWTETFWTRPPNPRSGMEKSE